MNNNFCAWIKCKHSYQMFLLLLTQSQVAVVWRSIPAELATFGLKKNKTAWEALLLFSKITAIKLVDESCVTFKHVLSKTTRFYKLSDHILSRDFSFLPSERCASSDFIPVILDLFILLGQNKKHRKPSVLFFTSHMWTVTDLMI